MMWGIVRCGYVPVRLHLGSN